MMRAEAYVGKKEKKSTSDLLKRTENHCRRNLMAMAMLVLEWYRLATSQRKSYGQRCAYKNLLETVRQPYNTEENMPLLWNFHQDNDLKHSSNLMKAWFREYNFDVIKWSSQFPDLDPVENL